MVSSMATVKSKTFHTINCVERITFPFIQLENGKISVPII